MKKEVCVVPEALALAKHGASAIHDVSRGGLLETLLEIAHLSRVEIEVDASLMPIRPVVARFAETFHFDPFRMISSGTLATTVPPDRLNDVKNALGNIGVPLSDVGRVSDGVGVRLLRKEGTKQCRQIRCKDDELSRIWTLYLRD